MWIKQQQNEFCTPYTVFNFAIDLFHATEIRKHPEGFSIIGSTNWFPFAKATRFTKLTPATDYASAGNTQ